MKAPRVWLLDQRLLFPPAAWAPDDGLLAIGGDLSPQRLLLAYRSGIFPWFNSDDDPILWHSPPERLVFRPGAFHVARSLRKAIRQHTRRETLRLTLDQAFRLVMEGCARAPGRGADKTWITPGMVKAYTRLHRLGHGHSVEVWNAADELVGGVYGLAIGGAFFAESMFSLQPNASKIALAALTDHLWRHGFHFLDAQMPTDHLLSLGGTVWSRGRYLTELERAVRARAADGVWEAGALAFPEGLIRRGAAGTH
ncbi:MAG: leucyl/phenylalanyl-tRNA--protein transferase [Sumerlaeia bacterium]